ncbi:hypothetical protein [Leptospira alexanderi]|nr:hypothetical protein [Leptospira alexanderi]
MNDKQDLILVEQFFKVKKKICPERITTFNISKTDFQVKYTDGGFFYCEVKSPKLVFNKIFNGYKHSTILSKLSDLQHTACKQFKKTNPQHIVPNILVWISRDFQLNWTDLESCFLGQITVKSQLIYDFKKSHFYQKATNDLGIIDYHIWLQANMNNTIYEETHFQVQNTKMSLQLIKLLQENIIKAQW